MFELATRNICRAIGSALIAAAVLASDTNQAAALETVSVGIWAKSSRLNSSATEVPSCSLQMTGSDGLILRLSLDLQQRWTLSFTKSGWNSTIGNEQRFYLKVDNGPFYRSVVFVDERHMAHTVLKRDRGLFRALKRGRILKIANDSATTSIRLGKPGQVIELLEACARPEPATRLEWRVSKGGHGALTPGS